MTCMFISTLQPFFHMSIKQLNPSFLYAVYFSTAATKCPVVDDNKLFYAPSKKTSKWKLFVDSLLNRKGREGKKNPKMFSSHWFLEKGREINMFAAGESFPESSSSLSVFVSFTVRFPLSDKSHRSFTGEELYLNTHIMQLTVTRRRKMQQSDRAPTLPRIILCTAGKLEELV